MSKRARLLVPALLVSVLAGNGCRSYPERSDVPTVEVDLAGRAPSPAPSSAGYRGEHLRIAIAEMMSPGATLVQYRDLLDYLGKRLGIPVEMKQRRTYQEVNDLLLSGRVEAAFLCSGGYVRAGPKLEGELLAIPVVNGKTTYQSYIIVGCKSGFRRFEDLEGHSFAFTDPLSNTGWLYPAYRLKGLGKTPSSFFSHAGYTHSHDRSIRSVGGGLVDGAAVDSLVYEFMAAESPEITRATRVIERSPEFGIPPIVSSPALAPERKRALQDVLVQMHRDAAGKRILNRLHIDRFVDPAPAAYNGVREMARSLGQWHR